MKEDVINSKLTQYESFFWSPVHLDHSAWIEHIPFAFWITEVFKPKVLVELGVHNGVSYFSFCQAVKALNINCACYAVDTWKGDEHAGFYPEEVFEKVTRHNTDEFSRFSTLIRSTFDEAKEYFLDRSIDLLHIDGLHTYEAVKHDFEAWLPKLSDNSLVLFHDVNVREKNFGVFKLWNELKEKYLNFQFDFGYGLGILCIGKFTQPELKELFDRNRGVEYYTFLRNIFSDRGVFFKTNFENGLRLRDEGNKLNSLNSQIAELGATKSALDLANNQLRTNLEALELANHQQQEIVEQLSKRSTTVESNYKVLQERYQKDITDLVERQKELDASITDISGKLSAAEKENELFRKNLNWYRDTYENRSIFGVLKEKITSVLKKKPKNNRYYLLPSNDVELSGQGMYSAVGTDPFFLVDLKNRRIRGGWYWLSIQIMEQEGVLLSPRLYYDCGRQFNEEDVWNLPKIRAGKIECIIKFPHNVKQLRFDPTTIECIFSVKEFHLKPIGSLKAFRIAVSEYRKSQSYHRSVSVYSDMLSALFKTGVSGVKKKLWDSVCLSEQRIHEKYTNWCTLYDTISHKEFENIKLLSEALSYKPVFSIVMPVYNVPEPYLRKAIESVFHQAYKNWELCIADDKSTNKDVKGILQEYQQKDDRIKIVFREANGRISHASNSALQLATGDYMVLLDADDELAPHALYMVARTINENKNLELIYSDEDKIDEQGNRYEPYFKTDWNKDLFYGQNMINHLGVYKLSLIKKTGGFRSEYEGSQDYDLALRCIESLNENQIHHIPHILYHWRAIKGSAAYSISNKETVIDAGLRALKDHLKRTGQQAIAEPNIHSSYRVKWRLPDKTPKVSIIIPTKDKGAILATCVTSVLENTSYENFEMLIIDNNSEDPLTLEYLKTFRENNRVKVHTYESEFNFSAIVNYGVQQSTGEVIVLLNNDTEVINRDWLSEMVSQSIRPEIGAVGAKLFYPNGQIQHAGVFLYDGHPGNHIYLRKEKNDPGYFNKLNLVQNYSVVTAACLAIRKQLYLKAGGFDEENLKVAYNDVDFCLKVRELGYKNIWTPFAQLIHYESLSRGSDLDGTNFIRFKKEHSYMLSKWKDAITDDPFFNPNLGHDTRTNQLAFPPRVKYEWQEN